MALSIGQAQAANLFAHYLAVTPAADGRHVTADEASEALAVLLDGANKTLGAGLRGTDAAAAIAAVEQLRAELAAARVVFQIVAGIGGVDGEQGLALTQAWMDWAHTPGAPKTLSRPEFEPTLRALVERRQEIRARTLAKIRGEAADV